MRESYGRQLRVRRERLALTQQQLAEQAAVSVATIRDLEQGRSAAPRTGTQRALARVIGLDAGDGAAVTAIEVLGPLRLWRDVIFECLGHGGQRVVLARLALTPHSPVHRDELVDLLWAARPPASAVNMVHAYMGRIRRLLHGAAGGQGPVTVALTAAGYQLDLPDENHDAKVFARLASLAAPDRAELEAALDQWRGRPVEDITELANHPAVVHLEQQRFAVAARLAQTARDSGEAARVLPRLRQLATAYPLNEGLQHQLIETLAASGQQTAARHAYQEFADRLAAEVGATPDAALQRTFVNLPSPQPPVQVSPRLPEITIGVLGPVELTVAGRPVRVPRSQRRGLLALLALRAQMTISKSEIIEAMWGGQPPATASRQVHSAIAALRKLLHVAGSRGVLNSVAAGYQLCCSRERIDAHAFEQLIVKAHQARAAGDSAAAVHLLTRAEKLWRGTPLGGASGFFVDAQRSRLEQTRLSCLEDLADLELRQGPSPQLADRLHSLVAEHPGREGLRLLLMRALHAAGRTLEALETARAYRGYLTEEFGLDPGTELAELERALLRGDSTDIGAPARPRALVSPAQLPPPGRHLIGRDAELGRLTSMLDGLGDRAATVAITGPAGVGKTALATAWCQSIRHRFPDGQIFISLNGFHDATRVPPERALEAMLRSLDVPADQIPGSVAQRSALWRSKTAGKRLLVLVDDVPGSEQVRPLLPGEGQHLTVVTSRRRLSGLVARDDAAILPLAPLAGAPSRALLAALAPGQQAVDLQAVAAHCAGLPLALKIAGARLQLAYPSAASVVSLLEGEETRLSALSIDDVAVRAALMSSYVALDPGVARMLRVLAVHPGPRPSLAICAATSGDTVAAARQNLEQLVEAHLADEAGEDRYGLHDLIRLFAREQAAGEEDELLGRAVDWYVHASNSAGQLLRRLPVTLGLDRPAPPAATMPALADSDQAVAWLDAEMANIEALIRACDRRDWNDAVWRLIHAPTPLLGMRHSTGAWTALADLGRRAAQRDGNMQAEASFHNALGIAAAFTGRFTAAEEHFCTALRLNRRLGDAELVTAARLNLGALHGDMGKVETAVQELTAVVREQRAHSSRRWLSPALNSLCDNLLRLKRYAECRDYAADAWQVAITAGDVQSAAYARCNLANALAALAFPAEAAQGYQETLRLARQCGDTRLEAKARRNYGDLLAAAGQVSEAQGQWSEALTLLISLNSDEADEVRRLLEAEPPRH